MKDLSIKNEEVVSEYFKNRGAQVIKLDRPRRQSSDASDWYVAYSGFEFLCELKTIMSVRASMPYSSPVDRLVEERDRQKAKIEQWIATNPGQQLVMIPEDYEYLNMPEQDFRMKHAKRKRYTDSLFAEAFSQKVQDHFQSSPINGLPYIIEITSDDMYVPNEKELTSFIRWLENEIDVISQGGCSESWDVIYTEFDDHPLYFSHYTLHEKNNQNDFASQLSLRISFSKSSNRLTINFYTHGGLNLEAIDRNIEKARSQLTQSAKQQKDKDIARIIVLAFADSLDLTERIQLAKHIGGLFDQYQDLSAVVLLSMTSNPELIQQTETSDPIDWIIASLGVPLIPHFLVLHNPLLQQVKPLDPIVFSDAVSKQFHDFSYLLFPDW